MVYSGMMKIQTQATSPPFLKLHFMHSEVQKNSVIAWDTKGNLLLRYLSNMRLFQNQMSARYHCRAETWNTLCPILTRYQKRFQQQILYNYYSFKSHTLRLIVTTGNVWDLSIFICECCITIKWGSNLKQECCLVVVLWFYITFWLICCVLMCF